MLLQPDKLVCALIVAPRGATLSTGRAPYIPFDALTEKIQRLYEVGIRRTRLYVYI